MSWRKEKKKKEKDPGGIQIALIMNITFQPAEMQQSIAWSSFSLVLRCTRVWSIQDWKPLYLSQGDTKEILRQLFVKFVLWNLTSRPVKSEHVEFIVKSLDVEDNQNVLSASWNIVVSCHCASRDPYKHCGPPW